MADRLVASPLDPAALREEIAGGSEAVCVFAGTVRRSNRGREVASLRYEAHGPVGERVLRELEEQAEREAGVRRCRVVHRVGELAVGEVSVLVAVAAGTPDGAAATAERTMDRLKERLPVWKEEAYADGTSSFLDGHSLRSESEAEAPDGDEPGGREPDGEPPVPEEPRPDEDSASGGAP